MRQGHHDARHEEQTGAGHRGIPAAPETVPGRSWMTAAEDRRVLEALSGAIAERTPVVLATVVATKRSAPRRAGTKMLVFAGDRQLGTIGGGAMERRVLDEAGEVLETGRPRLLDYQLVDPERGDPGVCGGEVQIYLEPYMPAHTIYVVGCGHVGRTVVDLAHWLGYRTIAIDDRPENVSEEAVPGADIRVAGTLGDALTQHPPSEDASIVLVTRNVDIDVEALRPALATPARYVGVMGSTTRWRTARKLLVDGGLDDHALERVHAPIGIELHAETLEEIAVSILSEIIRVNRLAATDAAG